MTTRPQRPGNSAPAPGFIPPAREGTPRSSRTREQLLAAAREIFVERGYHAATMDLVAERAGTARTTVFNHFPTKADLMRSVAVRESAELEPVLARSTGDTSKKLLAALRAWGRSYDRDPVAVGTLVQGWLATQAGAETTSTLPSSLFCRVLAEGQMLGEVAKEIDVDLAGAALSDACMGALARLTINAGSPRRLSAARTLVAIGRLFSYGIVADKPTS